MNQLKTANYVAVGRKTNAYPLDGKFLTECFVYKATVKNNNFEQPRDVYWTNRKLIQDGI